VNALALKMERMAAARRHEAERMLKARVMVSTGPEQDHYIEWLLARHPKKAGPAKEKASAEGDAFITVKAIAFAGADPADPYAPFKEALKAGKTVQFNYDPSVTDRWFDCQVRAYALDFQFPPHMYRIKE